MALYVLVFMGTNPIGAPLIGWFAGRYGARAAIWVGGAITLAVESPRSRYACAWPVAGSGCGYARCPASTSSSRPYDQRSGGNSRRRPAAAPAPGGTGEPPAPARPRRP